MMKLFLKEDLPMAGFMFTFVIALNHILSKVAIFQPSSGAKILRTTQTDKTVQFAGQLNEYLCRVIIMI